MARKNFGIVLLATVTVFAGTALAQKSNEVAGVIGRSFISDQSVSGSTVKVQFNNGVTYEANYAHRFLNFGVAGISVEVPFVFNPANNVSFSAGNVVPKDFRAYFITPAAKVTLFPTTAFNPWVSVGGGFASFSPNSKLQFGGVNPGKSTTSGVFEVGGGLDVRFWGPFKVRGEVRDFNTNEMPINLNTNNRYSHLYAGAGVVFSF